MFVAAPLFIVAERWGHPRVHRQMNGRTEQETCAPENALQPRTEVVTHAATWINLGSVTLGEIRTEGEIILSSHLREIAGVGRVIGTRVDWTLPRVRGGRHGELLLNGDRVSV